MCRFLAYQGPEIALEDLVLRPTNSLIDQSLEAHEAKLSVNGDGFGLAWYGRHEEPGTFKNILPAWSDTNLSSLCKHIRAALFLAHVRAATAGEVTFANCHPFTWGRWSFMHNGQLGAYGLLRRHLEALLPDDLYMLRKGSTDSELFFLLLIALGLEDDVQAAINHLIELIVKLENNRGAKPGFRFTAALSNGAQIYGVRFASDGKPPTLYVKDQGSKGNILASEPLDSSDPNWTCVSPSTLLRLCPEKGIESYPLGAGGVFSPRS